MHFISEIITHSILFISLYLEVFFLITYFEFLEKRKKVRSTPSVERTKFPSVSVIVPIWNEGNTVLKTIFSILKLDYPKNKLFILIVDDGSIDNTWATVQRFKNNKQVRLFQKENGGRSIL